MQYSKSSPRPTWLILDVSCLAWRAFYSIGDLSHEGVSTGVVYAILRDIEDLQARFGTSRVAFCFDRGRPKRCLVYPNYKQKRKDRREQDPVLMKARETIRKQLIALHDDYLPAIGFRNVFSQVGYEADDLIAVVADAVIADDGRAIVVSSDHDLWQLIGYRIRIWNPAKPDLITQKKFGQRHGISPSMWPLVKAIAGCSTDGVEGIKGVGEKTAIRYVTGSLPPGKAFEEITKGHRIIDRNLKLVRLPYAGVKPVQLRPDEVTRARFVALSKRLGINAARLSIRTA